MPQAHQGRRLKRKPKPGEKGREQIAPAVGTPLPIVADLSAERIDLRRPKASVCFPSGIQAQAPQHDCPHEHCKGPSASASATGKANALGQIRISYAKTRASKLQELSVQILYHWYLPMRSFMRIHAQLL